MRQVQVCEATSERAALSQSAVRPDGELTGPDFHPRPTRTVSIERAWIGFPIHLVEIGEKVPHFVIVRYGARGKPAWGKPLQWYPPLDWLQSENRQQKVRRPPRRIAGCPDFLRFPRKVPHLAPEDERELLAIIKHGSPKRRQRAKGIIFVAYLKAIHLHARNFNRNLTPDDVQDVYALAWNLLDLYDPARGSFNGFLKQEINGLFSHALRDAMQQKRGGGSELLSLDAMQAQEQDT
jgi:hypothetical protein